MLFNKAGEMKPSIIFIDEIDSMCGNRGEGEQESTRRVKTELLVQMQGVGKDNEEVLVLGATNLPWALDPAIRRRFPLYFSSFFHKFHRFEKRIYIPLPDKVARRYLINLQAKKAEVSLSNNELDQLADVTEGQSGSDISIFINDAVMEPVRLL